MTTPPRSPRQTAAGGGTDPAVSREDLERENMLGERRASARKLFIAAAVLAGLAVLAWIVVATTGGWVHGPALAISVGAPVAAVGLAAAATISTRQYTPARRVARPMR